MILNVVVLFQLQSMDLIDSHSTSSVVQNPYTCTITRLEIQQGPQVGASAVFRNSELLFHNYVFKAPQTKLQNHWRHGRSKKTGFTCHIGTVGPFMSRFGPTASHSCTVAMDAPLLYLQCARV